MAQTKINKRLAKVLSALHGRLYRVSGGRFGNNMVGGQIILLTTTGRESGRLRERPLVGGDHPNGWVVVASFSGHDQHPAWYLNLKANPTASVTAGSSTQTVTAREASGEERSKLWAEMVATYADYDEYQKVTDREIPVVVLERN